MRVASSYINYTYDETKAYNNSKGKLVVDAQCKCGRCTNGVYVCRVENGVPVPHPAFGGICLECGGTGVIYKTIRLYTDEEFEKMEKANQRRQEKTKAERDAKIEAEYANNRKEWLITNGFNEEEKTYIYFPSDSYDVKDNLKQAGFRFNSSLLWHIAEPPAGYEDKLIVVTLDEVAQLGAWGKGCFKADARDLIDKRIEQARPQSTSEWIGEEKEKLNQYPVTLVSVHGFEGYYGFSQVVKFVDVQGNILTWFTAVDINFDLGDELLLSGTIKQHSEYKGEKSTVLTRCKLKSRD